MNKTAELVRQWAEYEAAHPDAQIDEFCLHYLTVRREQDNQVKFAGSAIPPDANSVLAKMLGRIVKLHSTYALKALKECGLNNFDDFVYLNSIAMEDGLQKTQVIYTNFSELSSGLLILRRLLTAGLITEQADKEDKRSKRLLMTAKGKETLQKCYKRMNRINDLFFRDLPNEDVRLCIQLLSRIEAKFSERWLFDKGKSLGELIR